MNFYYVTLECLKKSPGVKKKILGQMKAFESYGFNVSLIATEHDGVLSRVFEMFKLLRANNSSVYYFRGFGFLFALFKSKLRALKKNGNLLVLELPSPVATLKEEFIKDKDNIITRKIKWFLFIKSFPSVFKYFDLVVEFASEEPKYVQGFEDKFVHISNGVDVEGIKLKSKNESCGINLISVANVSNWHGFDRIIRGLYEYYNHGQLVQEVFYHCVGEGSDLENLKTLVRELSLEKYVIFHGTKTGEDLDKVFDECDIAFGSLGFHRIGLNGGSPLKASEYCARGIPFVIAYEDWDFPETFPFVYRISKDDTPVDISQVIKWYENLIKEHPNYSIEMRRYAEENLSWQAKLRPVLERIAKMICSSN